MVDEPIRAPTRTILALDDSQIIQASSAVFPLREDRTVDLGSGVTGMLRAQTLVYPWHQFALSIISNSLGDRPIYFASSGDAADALGLTPFLVRQGVAYKLNPGLPDPEVLEGVEELSLSPLSSVTGLWLDVERTRKLAWEVFQVQQSVLGFWPQRQRCGH